MVGRRLVLIVGAVLMVGAGAAFAVARDPLLLLLAATIGVISPSGNEVGPFLAVEQASLTQRLPAERRTSVLARSAIKCRRHLVYLLSSGGFTKTIAFPRKRCVQFLLRSGQKTRFTQLIALEAQRLRHWNCALLWCLR